MRVRAYGDEEVRARLAAWESQPFNYTELGTTRSEAPAPGLCSDRASVLLGHGAACIERARSALARWAQFDLGWVELCFPERAPSPGALVAVRVKTYGLWTLNPTRVLYTLDEEARHGYAYGTLVGHVEAGEERFLVEHDPGDGAVRYTILARSRPAHPLVRLALPLARHAQRRFAVDSCRAMHRAVGSSLPCQPELVRAERPPYESASS